MKIDLWTKVVFTVIAGCLLILAVRSLQVIPAQAGGVKIYQVDIRKIGGNYVFLYDLIKKPGQK